MGISKLILPNSKIYNPVSGVSSVSAGTGATINGLLELYGSGYIKKLICSIDTPVNVGAYSRAWFRITIDGVVKMEFNVCSYQNMGTACSGYVMDDSIITHNNFPGIMVDAQKIGTFTKIISSQPYTEAENNSNGHYGVIKVLPEPIYFKSSLKVETKELTGEAQAKRLAYSIAKE